jgi:hypothetical protein
MGMVRTIKYRDAILLTTPEGREIRLEFMKSPNNGRPQIYLGVDPGVKITRYPSPLFDEQHEVYPKRNSVPLPWVRHGGQPLPSPGESPCDPIPSTPSSPPRKPSDSLSASRPAFMPRRSGGGPTSPPSVPLHPAPTSGTPATSSAGERTN